MADIFKNPIEKVKQVVLKGCWKRFKKSKKDHKKRYFFATCLIKLGTFAGFITVSAMKFDEFMKKPDYQALCNHVVSDELTVVLDQTNCDMTVDLDKLTCNTDYGDNPIPTSQYGSQNSGYAKGNLEYQSEDTDYDSGDSGNDSGASVHETEDTGYHNGQNSTDTGGNRRGRTLSKSSTSKPRKLQEYTYSNTLETEEARTARNFANEVNKGYLVFLYVIWILFDVGFRIHNIIHTYKSRIICVVPRYTKWQKIKFSIYENLIDMCVATALYPFTYPEYGDCLECPISFICSFWLYILVNIGFYIVLISILLTMNDKTKQKYKKFIYDLINQIKCSNQGDKSGKCFVRYFVCFVVVCVNLFAMVAVIIVVVDYISTVYSTIQLFISTFFYFALFSNGQVGRAQVAPSGSNQEYQNPPLTASRIEVREAFY